MRKEKALIFLFLLFTFLVYSNSFNIPFYFDDTHMIVGNLFIKNLKYLPLFFKGYVTSFPIKKGMCRPLLMLTFFINYWSGGLNPLSFHILNILFHFLNGLVLFLLLKFFKKDSSLTVIFFVALLFLSHPLNTEAVNYISCRSDLMVTLFLGIAFLCYLKERHILSLFCYILCLLSKETGLCFPFLVIAYDFIFLSRGINLAYLKKRQRMLFYLSFLSLTFIYFLYKDIFFQSKGYFLPVRSFYANFLLQSFVSFFYLRLFLFPYPLNLAHSWPEFNTLFEPLAFFSLLGIITLIVFIFIFKKRNPLISFGIAWYLVGLLPKFYARLQYPAMEHHFYLPSVGIYLIVFDIGCRIYLKNKKYFIYPLLGVILSFSLLSWLRNYEWQDKFRFWRIAVGREPSSGIAHNQLGLEYLKKGMLDKAEKEFEKAVKTAHNISVIVHSKGNLAGIYRERKEYEKAIKTLKEILSLGFPPPHLYEDLGLIYMEMGKEKEAVLSWIKEAKVYPQMPNSYVLLALYYIKGKQLKKAERLLNKALRLNPDFYLTCYGLGLLYEKKKELTLAKKYYKKAISLKPSFVDAHYSLGRVYAQEGNSKAIEEFKIAIRLNPQDARVYNDLAVCYASLNPPNWRLAKEYIEEAKKRGYPVEKELIDLIDKNLAP